MEISKKKTQGNPKKYKGVMFFSEKKNYYKLKKNQVLKF